MCPNKIDLSAVVPARSEHGSKDLIADYVYFYFKSLSFLMYFSIKAPLFPQPGLYLEFIVLCNELCLCAFDKLSD